VLGMPKVIGYHDWDSIKVDYCSGNMTVPQLAAKWRIKEATLRSRASRGEWPTPTRFRQTMDKAIQIATEAVAQGFRNSEEPGSPEEMAMRGIAPLSLAGDSLQPNASAASVMDALTYQQAMAQFACRSVAAGFGRIKPPSNWREIATADTIARRALGLDSKGGGGGTTMIRISGPAGTVDFATSVPVDMTDDDESEWDD